MLKSLELFGFKSFADRTTFDFHPGITAVVGPNGSGKSNVVDAIKWILGDQSAKSLRGKEMSDVIFNGAANRKGSSLAEATLTFDNSNGTLPIDSVEVRIGRRLWRSGDAEYLINGTPARLKEVRNLLIETGIGSSAYCIIEQGRVDKIVQANATSRRAIFEEAAGISSYKARRIEALRKLDRVDQHLLRLTDIVDEAEARLTSLRGQAQKAAKYRELSQELRQYWIGLAADDYRYQTSLMHESDLRIAQRRIDIDSKNERLQEQERELAAFDDEIAEFDNRVREAERQSATNREAIASHEATIRHQTARKHELDGELVRLRKQRTVMRARKREVAGEIDQIEQQLAQFEDDFQTKTKEHVARKDQLRELASSINAIRETRKTNREHLLNRTRDVSDVENRVTGLRKQQEAAREEQQGTEQRLEELNKKIAECTDERDACRERADEAQQAITEAKETVNGIRRAHQTLIGEQGDYQRTLAELREQRSAHKARKSILKDLEIRQEGMGIGVKDILKRARSSDHPPWNRILGSVADLLEVDLEQAALLEVALGSRAQLLVIKEFDSLIDYLARGASQISGRVGFIAYSSDTATTKTASKKSKQPGSAESDDVFEHFRIDSESLPDLSQHDGVMQRADECVRTPEHLPQLAEQLLADTWIVDTLDVAIALSSDAGRGCRFVTLQGERLDPDGTLSVGTVRSESALVSRKSELRRLKQDIIDLDGTISDEEQRLATLDDSLDETDESLQAAKSELRKQSDQHRKRTQELANQEQELERLVRDQKGLEAEVAESITRQETYAGELESALMEQACAEEDLRSLQTVIDEADRDIARNEHRLQGLDQKSTADSLELAKHEERRNGLRNALDRLEQDQQQRNQQSDEAERRFDAVVSRSRQITLHTLNTSAVMAELFLTEEHFAETATTLLTEREQLRHQRAEHVKQAAALRDARRKLNELQHSDEIALRDVRFQISALEQRMEEEYQLNLADVAESGVSAVELHLAEIEPSPADESASDENTSDLEADDSDVDETLVDDEDAEATESPAFEEEESKEDEADRAAARRERFLEVREELEAKVNRLRRKLKLIGSVNTDSLHDLDELESRYGQLSEQLQDLVEAKTALAEIVRRINVESKRLFLETFEAVRVHFSGLFRKLFGGGEGSIVLEDPEDVLECGIDIVARPPGKEELKSISLLSGGEKTLTAFALLLALFKTRPSVYCLLDEVDAALDEANISRMLAVLEEFRKSTQFVVITHRKPTMTIADLLYGVTMEQSGVSKKMNVRFEDISENGDFKASAKNSSNERTPPPDQGREAA